jgi:hypothetical protein
MGVRGKFESFVGNLGRFAPPPTPTGKSEFSPLSRGPGTPIEQKMDAFGHPNSGEKGKLFSIISLSLIYLKQNSFNSHYYYTLI